MAINTVKISQLPSGDTLTGPEFFEIVQNGQSRKATLAQVLAYTDGGITWPLVSTDGNLSFGSDVGTQAYIDDNGTFSFDGIYSTGGLLGITLGLYLNGCTINPSNIGDPILELNGNILFGTDGNSNPYIETVSEQQLTFSSDGTTLIWSGDALVEGRFTIGSYEISDGAGLYTPLGHVLSNGSAHLYYQSGNILVDTSDNLFLPTVASGGLLVDANNSTGLEGQIITVTSGVPTWTNPKTLFSQQSETLTTGGSETLTIDQGYNFLTYQIEAQAGSGTYTRTIQLTNTNRTTGDKLCLVLSFDATSNPTVQINNIATSNIFSLSGNAAIAYKYQAWFTYDGSDWKLDE